MAKESHLERTAKEPRDEALHTVVIKQIDQINDSIRVFRFGIPDQKTIKFSAGQWLDVYVPTVPKAGGFTITSAPSAAVAQQRTESPNGQAPPQEAYLELAIQKSPNNPPAAWLWKPLSDIMNAEVKVRVGGSFIWPPAGIDVSALRKVVLVAGGVGINPLISILSAIADDMKGGKLPDGCEVTMLYSMKDPGPPRNVEKMLFVERIAELFAKEDVRGMFRLFLTGPHGTQESNMKDAIVDCHGFIVKFANRRISLEDISSAIGGDKSSAVVYVCGVPTMTDEMVEKLVSDDGLAMARDRVLFEKWW
ncbi:hypothetical protein B0T20DRAFT_474917 [Sordaria brevicollis]|uniref:Oxidoreductase NAD-binding domain-containing protein 1 n=1 Tax=Sordaria brevicollis TaxID=83679 RepID=A0AAE0PNI1_SORBR|nr:hypothetical protein B0T20DRAFT_474917 [Sordaria brevicollis]